MLSVTVILNVTVSVVDGAVNEGVEVSSLVKLTCVPPVCFHLYETMEPSVSLDAEPSNVTITLLFTDRSEPAFAVGL